MESLSASPSPILNRVKFHYFEIVILRSRFQNLRRKLAEAIEWTLIASFRWCCPLALSYDLANNFCKNTPIYKQKSLKYAKEWKIHFHCSHVEPFYLRTQILTLKQSKFLLENTYLFYLLPKRNILRKIMMSVPTFLEKKKIKKYIYI